MQKKKKDKGKKHTQKNKQPKRKRESKRMAFGLCNYVMSNQN